MWQPQVAMIWRLNESLRVQGEERKTVSHDHETTRWVPFCRSLRNLGLPPIETSRDPTIQLRAERSGC